VASVRATLCATSDPTENIIDKVMEVGSTRADTRVRSRWFGRGKFQESGAWVTYYFFRAITVTIIFYFACHLLGWLPKSHPLQWMDQTPLPWRCLNEAIWLATPLLAGKALWEVFARNAGLTAKLGLWLRQVAAVFWVAAVAGLAWNQSNGQSLQIKDWLGYLTGLVAAGLLWRLHTRVHKGLFQMWLYTKGKNTGAPEDKALYNASLVPPSAFAATLGPSAS
jgi:hypothetical protein